MWTNIIILLFLLFMAYMWGYWGLFSAFLHLGVVIVAGALALALWEPLVFKFGFPMKPEYAWGVWLVGPFVLLIIILRVILDKLVPKNMEFSRLTNYLAGGVCGLFAGVLVSGLTLVGVGFLPLVSNFGGYEPLGVDSATGQVRANTDTVLWVPVDRMAVDFYSALSSGTFKAGNAGRLALHQPQLSDQAALIRLRYTPYHSTVITPSSVELGAVHVRPTPVPNLLPTLAESLDSRKVAGREHQLIVIDTTFIKEPQSGTYDSDPLGTLRLSPSQVRLVTWRGPDEDRDGVPEARSAEAAMHAPRGFSKRNDFTKRRDFIAFDNPSRFAWSALSQETLGWTFVVPAGEVPRFLLIRHLRLELPTQVNDNADDLRTAIGDPEGTSVLAADGEPTTAPAEGPTTAPADGAVGDRTGPRAGSLALNIEVNPALPIPISVNVASMLSTSNNGVDSGTGEVKQSGVQLTDATRVSRINVPSDQALVRVRLVKDQAQGLLASARVAGARVGSIFLEDQTGEPYMPMGYVWVKRPGNVQEISVEPSRPIQSGAQLPVTRMGDEDELYLYFVVRRGVQITSYNLGTMKQFVTLQVPAQ